MISDIVTQLILIYTSASVVHLTVNEAECSEMDSSSGDKTVTSEAPQIEFDLFKAFSDPPLWMTKEYFEQVLRDSEKDPSLKVSSSIVLNSYVLSITEQNFIVVL